MNGPPATPVKPPAGKAAPRFAITLLTAALCTVGAIGAPYYLSPITIRVRHPLHAWLKPSGHVGQALGFLALALFLFLWLYPLRKKYGARWSFTGRISGWLNWHVAAGLMVPWVAGSHAGWRFTGLIGLGYLALFIVYLSGLVGRYLYTRIPRRRSGAEMTLDEVTAERERLLFELTAQTGLPPGEVREMLTPDSEAAEAHGLIAAFRKMMADDRARHRAVRDLAKRLSDRTAGARRLDRSAARVVLLLARREMALSQQIRMLEATQRAFGLWHVLHKPVAVTALLAVLAHVIVSVAVGATWIHS